MKPQRKRFKKLLVANRGEIAIRVLRAASELNLRTVAIYTYEDRYSLHRYKADEAYQVGADDDPLKPYLDIEGIIQIARENEVDAIHPGYGFLSENVNFARRCREEGIEFVGPSPESMERLGDKVAAKALARQEEVPLIEDSQEPLADVETALREAARIGYPIMVKAAAGGGGRGMRVVRSADGLPAAFQEAKREAGNAFGDDTIFLEKFIDQPKHIEVQLLGDKYGNLVHLYERDCSVQRRFQKVVEVAPCPSINEVTKQKLYDYAIRLGKAVNYSNAGTVEFLVDRNENIYFIEVNPRIQVEHTITEEITGVDIVRSQILIAMGYELSHRTIYIRNQDDVECSGFAVQCRVTTEDPSNGFKPDYGTLIAYRSASGMGIRLDAGSAFPGAKISPYFDSMLVKVTAWGRTLKGASQRLHRALREFRIRGVSTNIGFLLNLLQDETFQRGDATVNFIQDHPELLAMPDWRDRGTKLLRYLAEVIVNDNPDVKFKDPSKIFLEPVVPSFDPLATPPDGTRQILQKLGPERFAQWLKEQKSIQYTDTTFRDAHQSLLATRMRTYDMEKVAHSFAQRHANDVFSMEVWGGATFDVAMRFLKECPWKRLEFLREAIPNICFQMLLRGSNAVGYTAYPDNLIVKFVEEAAAAGIDIFRIFDSLNWVEAMKTSIRAVRERTNSVAEACICYTGDITDPKRAKYNLQYYIDLARQLEDEGAHIIAIKDMAGLLKPLAAQELIGALRSHIEAPIHLHTHDTSSIQASTYIKAIEAGVDVVDVAISSMSGLTSQPSFNAVAAMMQQHEREHPVDLHSLNEFSTYWEAVRRYYYPFETELRAGTAEVYEHEIPGGQYSNLRPQARALGLEEQFEAIKKNYRIANQLFGDIVKVTPSSKVVGDMAMFMTANNLTEQDIFEKGDKLAFPDSVKALMRGDLGQTPGGFPEKIQQLILKGEKPYTERPNAHLEPVDFDKEVPAFRQKFGQHLDMRNFLAYKLYPKVYEDYREHYETYALVRALPTPAFFFGLKPNEEIMVTLSKGKSLLVKYINMSEPDAQGVRLVFFQLNGQTRSVPVRDKSVQTEVVLNRKVTHDKQVGAPLQGNISKILVEEGQEVALNTPLFTIEAMKMESTITSPVAGKVKKVYLTEKTLVEQDDLVIELE
ncbi:pyruvate carboxylase [Phaeodactylibacter luteus]|uniref:Pyruvate carboxylase n=1 Tax=Phaeodactylibacter luteus TaxID=1564516 RepID=A0A5C6RUB8_9BACT|nr:pyruvate carboxylase [Phaeodactylibacter luteus]TXB65574.1 pyruvate carboxylase [Phaeodactylibacter luteus]